ncbi:MAG: hypothetical protein ABIC18_04725 [Candidatus Omnitrophota bacterium]
MRILRVLSIILVSACSVFIVTQNASAAFNVSVTPYEGGYNLKFGKISSTIPQINKEVVVNINSDIGAQYRLIQVLQDPLANSQGVSFPHGSFSVYAIRGTNHYGTLSAEIETPVLMGSTVVYTSNQQGLSDSFTLVYCLVVPPEQDPGSYRGKIRFTSEPIGSSESPSTVIFDVLAEVEAVSRVRVTTSSGGRVVQLKAQPQEKRYAEVKIDILGAMGREYKINQLLSEPLTSSEGVTLDLNSANFVVQGGQNGVALTNVTPLSLRQEALYTSGLRGQADSFIITYGLEDLNNQKAGIYRGKIQYLFEASGVASSIIDTIDLEVDNPEMFDLVVTPQLGTGFLRFDNLKPNEPPRISEVNIEVKTNTGRPYQVSQNIDSLLINKEGETVSAEYFSLQTEADGTIGKLKYPEKTKVQLNDMVLFISDQSGSADKFKVIYELNVPLDLKAGDYSTRITYSITAI